MPNHEIILLCAISYLVLAITLPVNVSATSEKNEAFTPSEQKSIEDATKALDEISKIPDKVILKGEKAINEYAKEKELDIRFSGKERGFFGCTSAIGLALIYNFTPAKLLKVKSAIKAIGGAKKLATKMISSYKYYRSKKKYKRTAAIKAAAKSVGTTKAIKNILIDVFTLGGVAGSCFE